MYHYIGFNLGRDDRDTEDLLHCFKKIIQIYKTKIQVAPNFNIDNDIKQLLKEIREVDEETYEIAKQCLELEQELSISV
jgi:hypothetical protein